mmetsp:Transcript_44325/g.56746  ORF Transcript_44325/g.56746 Transcript_44325/m.56746 type:complete len:170 (-) Transcript_44325:1898-2407(-)
MGDSFGDANADIDDHYINISETIEYLLEQACVCLIYSYGSYDHLSLSLSADIHLSDGAPKKDSQGIAIRENISKNYLLEMIKAPKPQEASSFQYHANQVLDNSRNSFFQHQPWDRRDVFAEASKANCHPFHSEILRLEYRQEHVSPPNQVRPCPRPLTLKDMDQGIVPW